MGVLAQKWPPVRQEAKPAARWWWPGSAVDEENLRWNMEQYASHGLGALEVTPIYGVQGEDDKEIPFLTQRWMDVVRFTEREGKRLGIQIDMTCGTGWRFGGPWVPEEETACKVVFRDTVVNERDVASVRLLPPAKEKEHAKLKLQRAYPTEEKGKMRVIALYESRTMQPVAVAAPGGEGITIDHFDSTALAHYLGHLEEAFERTKTPYPHTFFNDSYEVYGADWTPTLLDEFYRRRGYRLEDYLPEFLGHGSRERWTQLISDYRETMGELLLKNFTEQWVDWCHRHGVKVRNQAHGSPANLIDCYAAVDIPEIEGFGLSEFGIRGLRTDPGKTRKNDSDLSMLKYAPSASHIMGKPFTSSETFTWLTEHFRTSLSQMKPDMDLMFCAGVNHMYFHGICYSPKDDPWPGWRFYASVDMSPTNTIWRDAPALMDYIARCQSFLQWGKPDNDFIVYLPIRDLWKKDLTNRFMTFSIHNMGKRAPEFIKTILDIDHAGYDCDYISERYLLTTSFSNGMLETAAGSRYKALILPDKCTLSPALNAHLSELKRQGATIIHGIKPIEMAASAKAEEMKTKLGLHLIRRQNDKGYHYFISNLSPNDVDRQTELAVDFADAMWFDAMTGKRYKAETEGKTIRVALRSGESLILETFDRPLKKRFPLRPEQGNLVKELNDGWTLSFSESVPGIDSIFSIGKLRTWENLTDSTRVLMGTGVYETTFSLQASEIGEQMFLDLGDVRESARVWLNGKEVGCAWAVPFVLNFPGKLLRRGNNSLRIEVTNLPANRIADFDRRGVKWRKMKGVNFYDVNYKKTTYDKWTLMPSGLNSTVRLYKGKELN